MKKHNSENSKTKILLDLFEQDTTLNPANLDSTTELKDRYSPGKTPFNIQKPSDKEGQLRILLQLAGTTAVEMNDPIDIIQKGLKLLSDRLSDKYGKPLAEVDNLMGACRSLSAIANKINNIPLLETGSFQDKKSGEKAQILNVLCIDDDVDFLKLISLILKKHLSVKIQTASNCREGEKLLSANMDKFNIILLDHNLPDGDSGRIMDFLKQNHLDIPVIIITGQGDEITATKLLKSGAVDYIPKLDIHKHKLYESIMHSVEQHRVRTELKFAMSKLVEMATKDSLTELYNRRYFFEALESEINRHERYKGDLSLCLIDVDKFKLINDTYGHSAGDLVLKDIARLMINSLRVSDIPCRYGGDEFAIIFPHTSENNAYSICERFRKSVEDYECHYNKARLTTTISIGLVSFEKDKDSSVISFLDRADRNLYEAKEQGRNCIGSDKLARIS